MQQKLNLNLNETKVTIKVVLDKGQNTEFFSSLYFPVLRKNLEI